MVPLLGRAYAIQSSNGHYVTLTSGGRIEATARETSAATRFQFLPGPEAEDEEDAEDEEPLV